MSDIDLSSIEEMLLVLNAEKTNVDLREAEINGQIAALRLELTNLREKRSALNQLCNTNQKYKESALRKLALEKEAEEIRQSLEDKRKEAEEILATAPWKDDAFQWQIDGALSLPERAIIADKRGMGKTLSSIIWRKLQKSERTLVCLRKEVASDFIKEINIREPGLFVYSLLGANAEQRKMAALLLEGQSNFIVVTNIESWRRDVDKTTEDILKIPYDAVILDEAHHIKTPHTGTAQGFFRLADKIPKVLELTGTPIKNKPQEMFSLLHALYPEHFEKERKFLADYCIQIAQNRWVFSPHGLKSLVAKISHFYISRSPEDVGRKVPPPKLIEYKLDFEAHPQQKQAYKDMTERSLAILGSGKVIPIVSQLAVMTRQAQVVSWPSGIIFEVKDEEGRVIETVRFDIEQSVKADWAEDLIRELVDEGERVIMFSRFKPAIYELKRRLVQAGLSVAVITGDEKAKGNTEEVFNDFDLKTAPKNPRYQVLLATYQTVGESANLNAARHMVLYDRFWNPGNEDQAIGRIDRINSIDQATVHIPLVEHSIDDYMTELIETKRTIVTDFKDASSMQAGLAEHLRKTL
jgi:SNF2 family DNA or RNA helicase